MTGSMPGECRYGYGGLGSELSSLRVHDNFAEFRMPWVVRCEPCMGGGGYLWAAAVETDNSGACYTMVPRVPRFKVLRVMQVL